GNVSNLPGLCVPAVDSECPYKTDTAEAFEVAGGFRHKSVSFLRWLQGQQYSKFGRDLAGTPQDVELAIGHIDAMYTFSHKDQVGIGLDYYKSTGDAFYPYTIGDLTSSTLGTSNYKAYEGVLGYTHWLPNNNVKAMANYVYGVQQGD